MKLFSAFFLLILLPINALQAATPKAVLSLPTLPERYIENRFEEIQKDLEKRESFYYKGRPAHKWAPNRSQADLLKEFSQLDEWRLNTWYADPNAEALVSRLDFMVAQDLLARKLYRESPFIAFQYNRTDESYNSSTIIFNDHKFLALEAPTKATLTNFFVLLQNYRIHQLVRLTPAKEAEVDKSYPYWENNTSTNDTNENFLEVPRLPNPKPFPVHYYYTDSWSEDGEIPPNRLLGLIKAVRKHYDPARGLLACHSTNGSGRTGTFLAGFLILSEIDRQIAAGVAKQDLDISIEKVVMKLSLQRPYLIANAEQYMVLYRLVDLYVSQLPAVTRKLTKSTN